MVFRSDLGTKLTAAENRVPASFQIDHADPDHQVGWSVLVRGRLVEVDRRDTSPDEEGADMNTAKRETPWHRGRIEELDAAECWRLLSSVDAGRLVHVVAAEPQVAVVNFSVDDQTIVLRSVPGSRLSLALANPGSSVLVQADDLDAETRSGWSVVVRGRMTPVLDQVTTAHLDRAMPPSWILGDSGGTWLRLSVDQITGRVLRPGGPPEA